MNQNNFNFTNFTNINNQKYRQNLMQNTNTIMKNNFQNLNPIMVSVQLDQYETSIPKENYIQKEREKDKLNQWTDNY